MARPRILTRAAWCAFGLAAAALPAAARPASQAPSAAQQGPSRSSPRHERWRALAPEERARILHHFREFKRMGEDERGVLMERWKRYDAWKRGDGPRLPEDLARALEELPPERRSEVVRDFLEHGVRELEGRLREALPPELRERLERASPEERARIVEELRAERRRRELERGLAELEERGLLAPEEIGRIRALPPREQASELMELRRRGIVERVEREGLPPWIEAREWQQWQELTTREFFLRWSEARRAQGARQAGLPDLASALRPDPRWFAELSHLPPPARWREMDARIRARALAVLERPGGPLAGEELAELRALHGRAFLDRLAEMLRDRR